MDWHQNYLRMARGGASITASGTENITVSLYNNTTGPYLLKVWYFNVADSLASTILGFAAVGSFGTLAQVGNPLVTDEAAPSGQLFTQHGTSLPGNDLGTIVASGGQYQWPVQYPFAILRPNWSFVFGSNVTNGVALRAAFVWEMVDATALNYYRADYET